MVLRIASKANQPAGIPKCSCGASNSLPMNASQDITSSDGVVFTQRACHVLAREIQLRTDWAMCAFRDIGAVGEHRLPSLHTFIRMPDGHLLDVEGVHTEQEIYLRWWGKVIEDCVVIDEFSANEIGDKWGWPEDAAIETRARCLATKLIQTAVSKV